MTVYFIGSPTGHIKIGFTSNKKSTDRLASLQTGNPVRLKLLAEASGDQSVERQLHHRFAAHRVEGEWFSAEAELLSLVAYVKHHKTVEGWSTDSTISPMKRFGKSLTNSHTEDPLWRVVFAMEAHDLPPMHAQSYDELITRYWLPAMPANFALHVTSASNTGFFQTSFWIDRASDRRSWQTKGCQATAQHLVDVDHDPLKTASVWLQASLRYARHVTVRMEEVFPASDWLTEQASKVQRIDYHSRSWDVLPVPLHIPQRSVLTPADFIQMACANFTATLAQYTPVSTYLLGFHKRLAERAAA